MSNNDNLKDIFSNEGNKEVVNTLIAEKSLLDFVRQAWEILEPGVDFKDNWHLEYLEEELLLLVLDDVKNVLDLSEERIKYLKETEFKNRLDINIPPRTMKSLFIGVFFPAWVWIHNPTKKFITVSYSTDLSLDLNKKRRELISSDWYQERWGHIVKLKDEQNTKTYFENTNQGSMFSTSVGGTLTGKGGDIILLDDLQNPRQAESDADRLRAINFVTKTLPSRLNDNEKGVIVNIQQRLHFNDVSGYIRANYSFYKKITLPAETGETRYYVGPLSGKTYTFKAESVLWPKRMTPKWIKQIKEEQGARTYTAQYLQDPTPPGGNLVNIDQLRKWTRLPLYNPKLMEERRGKYKIVMSWDMNFKEKIGNDNVACAVFLTDEVTTYLVDIFEEQIGFVKTLDAVTKMKEKWEFILFKNNAKIPIEIIIEEAANGAAIMDVLKTSIPGMIPIKAVEDKITRMLSITPFIEAGNILVPDITNTAIQQECPWWEGTETELAKFPNVRHDDRSDAFSIGLRRIYVEPKEKRKRMAIY